MEIHDAIFLIAIFSLEHVLSAKKAASTAIVDQTSHSSIIAGTSITIAIRDHHHEHRFRVAGALADNAGRNWHRGLPL